MLQLINCLIHLDYNLLTSGWIGSWILIYGSTDAFAKIIYIIHIINKPLSGNYVEGVSIMYGTPTAEHVWTYVSGHQETGSHVSNCPCNTPPGTSPLS